MATSGRIQQRWTNPLGLQHHHAYRAVNGVSNAKGGSIDSAGPVVAGGKLFVVSGFSLWGGQPGNVLLVFSVEGR